MAPLPDLRPKDYPCASPDAAYGETYLEGSRSLAVRLEDSRIVDVTADSDCGMAVRFLRRRGRGSSAAVVGSARGHPPAADGRGADAVCARSSFQMGTAAASDIETLHGSSHGTDPLTAARLRRELLGERSARRVRRAQGPLDDSRRRRPGRVPLQDAGRDRPVQYPGKGVPLQDAGRGRVDPAGVPLDRKVSLLRSMDGVIRGEFPHIRQVTVTYSERTKAFLVIPSDGAARREDRTGLLLNVTVVAEKDGLLQSGNASIGGLRGFDLLAGSVPQDLARAAARRAVRKLDAPQARAGEMPVVISSSAGGTLVHEAIGHSLESDHVQDGTSPAYRGRLGARVAPAFISIVDDPTLPFFRGSFSSDDEGISARPTVLVRDGILNEYLYDRTTALRESRVSNGHGRRESFSSRPLPRMSNLYIAPGTEDPAAILRSLKTGLLVTRMGSGQADTTTGEFVFEVEEGYRVENGAVKHLIRDANLLGMGPEVLQSVDRLGWDIGWGLGTCCKDDQSVPVSDGQPTMRIPKMLVGGRHEGFGSGVL